MNGSCHLFGITMTSDMHVERRRRSSQNVIVDCCDVETAIEQFGHHGSDFGVQQHQIAHHHRFAVHRREGDPTTQGKRRLDGYAFESHFKIGPGGDRSDEPHPKWQPFYRAPYQLFSNLYLLHGRDTVGL
jgi:hypothetical protein